MIRPCIRRALALLQYPLQLRCCERATLHAFSASAQLQTKSLKSKPEDNMLRLTLIV